MILYIHGFGGSGKGVKAELFREHYHDKEHFLAPSLSYIPDTALASLEEIIELFLQFEPVFLIGSSLGGFYAMYLSQKYNLPAALINPAADPITLSRKLEGDAPSYYDESYFRWLPSHTDFLLKIKESLHDDFSNVLAFINKGDEVVPYTESVKVLETAEVVLEEGGDHSFADISRFFEKIDQFFKSYH